MHLFKNEYYDMPVEEYFKRGLLTREEADYLENIRIPYEAGIAPWLEFYKIQDKIMKAIESGKVDKHIKAEQQDSGIALHSDYLPGGEMVSHADGKAYTSKKEYIKGVERSGGNIMEERRYTKIEKPDSFDNKKFDQSFKKALEQHGL